MSEQEKSSYGKGNRYLIVVDMQNDFVAGSLGTKEAEHIVAAVCKKVEEFSGNIIMTLDTHQENYLDTQEGHYLPVKHCIQDTEGWQLVDGLAKLQSEKNIKLYRKPTFASVELAKDMLAVHENTPIEEIELVGLCTDICVISNALMLKGFMPEVPISVDASCCAGVTPEKHDAALQTMESCQILVKNKRN